MMENIRISNGAQRRRHAMLWHNAMIHRVGSNGGDYSLDRQSSLRQGTARRGHNVHIALTLCEILPLTCGSQLCVFLTCFRANRAIFEEPTFEETLPESFDLSHPTVLRYVAWVPDPAITEDLVLTVEFAQLGVPERSEGWLYVPMNTTATWDDITLYTQSPQLLAVPEKNRELLIHPSPNLRVSATIRVLHHQSEVRDSNLAVLHRCIPPFSIIGAERVPNSPWQEHSTFHGGGPSAEAASGCTLLFRLRGLKVAPHIAAHLETLEARGINSHWFECFLHNGYVYVHVGSIAINDRLQLWFPDYEDTKVALVLVLLVQGTRCPKAAAWGIHFPFHPLYCNGTLSADESDMSVEHFFDDCVLGSHRMELMSTVDKMICGYRIQPLRLSGEDEPTSPQTNKRALNDNSTTLTNVTSAGALRATGSADTYTVIMELTRDVHTTIGKLRRRVQGTTGAFRREDHQLQAVTRSNSVRTAQSSQKVQERPLYQQDTFDEVSSTTGTDSSYDHESTVSEKSRDTSETSSTSYTSHSGISRPSHSDTSDTTTLDERPRLKNKEPKLLKLTNQKMEAVLMRMDELTKEVVNLRLTRMGVTVRDDTAVHAIFSEGSQRELVPCPSALTRIPYALLDELKRHFLHTWRDPVRNLPVLSRASQRNDPSADGSGLVLLPRTDDVALSVTNPSSILQLCFLGLSLDATREETSFFRNRGSASKKVGGGRSATRKGQILFSFAHHVVHLKDVQLDAVSQRQGKSEMILYKMHGERSEDEAILWTEPWVAEITNLLELHKEVSASKDHPTKHLQWQRQVTLLHGYLNQKTHGTLYIALLDAYGHAFARAELPLQNVWRSGSNFLDIDCTLHAHNGWGGCTAEIMTNPLRHNSPEAIGQLHITVALFNGSSYLSQLPSYQAYVMGQGNTAPSSILKQKGGNKNPRVKRVIRVACLEPVTEARVVRPPELTQNNGSVQEQCVTAPSLKSEEPETISLHERRVRWVKENFLVPPPSTSLWNRKNRVAAIDFGMVQEQCAHLNALRDQQKSDIILQKIVSTHSETCFITPVLGYAERFRINMKNPFDKECVFSVHIEDTGCGLDAGKAKIHQECFVDMEACVQRHIRIISDDNTSWKAKLLLRAHECIELPMYFYCNGEGHFHPVHTFDTRSINVRFLTEFDCVKCVLIHTQLVPCPIERCVELYCRKGQREPIWVHLDDFSVEMGLTEYHIESTRSSIVQQSCKIPLFYPEELTLSTDMHNEQGRRDHNKAIDFRTKYTISHVSPVAEIDRGTKNMVAQCMVTAHVREYMIVSPGTNGFFDFEEMQGIVLFVHGTKQCDLWKSWSIRIRTVPCIHVEATPLGTLSRRTFPIRGANEGYRVVSLQPSYVRSMGTRASVFPLSSSQALDSLQPRLSLELLPIVPTIGDEIVVVVATPKECLAVCCRTSDPLDSMVHVAEMNAGVPGEYELMYHNTRSREVRVTAHVTGLHLNAIRLEPSEHIAPLGTQFHFIVSTERLQPSMYTWNIVLIESEVDGTYLGNKVHQLQFNVA